MLFVRAEIEARQVAKGVAHLLGRARIIAASRRRDEIGIAERELAGMQRDLGGRTATTLGCPRSPPIWCAAR
jgi:hypothetical protein